MKVLALTACILACALAAPSKPYKADKCDADKCKLPDCRCSGKDIPGGLDKIDTPQLVFLTFDDAVNEGNYKLYQEAFDGKNNPDDCPISTTYFVSHEYTEYRRVHDLYSNGHEIALHSITHTPSTDYWKNLSVETHKLEFGGERQLVAHFANIPESELKGVRLPLLQLSGENSFEAIHSLGLEYDCSWPTRNNFWPYTLDYASTQDCPLGPCPKESYPGTWVVPMIMMKDDLNVTCSMVDACTNIPDDADGIFEFLTKNFEVQYNGNRAPFGAYMHAAWFGQRENAFEAYLKFIDYLVSLDDVYIVSISKGLEWVRNPTKLSDIGSTWSSCRPLHRPSCGDGYNCELMKGNETRWMQTCADCPTLYPWLENPLGEPIKK